MISDNRIMFFKTDILYRFTVRFLPVLMLVSLSFTAKAQSDKKYIRQGNREYSKKEYSNSEVSYRKAADKNKMSPNAVFNIGDALYKQKKYDDAGKQFMESTSQNEDKVKKAEGYYNLGNSLLKSNKVQESINAYENSLRLDPGNMEAKYNLAYAQDLLRIQKQEQQQQQQQKNNKDNKDNKEKQQQQDNQKDNNKQQQNNQKNDQDKMNPKNQQNQQQQISKEDAERLLNALANDEKKVEEKVKLAKAAKEKVRTVKNW